MSIAGKILADPSYYESSAGAEFELAWSDDETVCWLYIGPANRRRTVLKLTSVELDDLRAFLNRNIA